MTVLVVLALVLIFHGAGTSESFGGAPLGWGEGRLIRRWVVLSWVEPGWRDWHIRRVWRSIVFFSIVGCAASLQTEHDIS